MSFPAPRRRWLGGIAATVLLFMASPAAVGAHSELKSSVPKEGATVESPFTGPIVLTFTEQLADGSKADLVGPDGSTVATATVDPDAATMTFEVASALAPGAYRAEWTSIADDGDLLRGIVTFTVGPAASPSPASPSPEPSITAAPSATAAPSSSAGATAPATAAAQSATATPAPSAGGDAAGGGSDVVLPIVILLILVAAGGFYLVRRNRPA